MSSPSSHPVARYTEAGFWRKLRRHALRAGREVIGHALCLYYAARQPGTPAWARTVIYGALAYFIAPVDVMPDIAPLLGFTDDLGVLMAALVTVALHIDDEVRARAQAQLAQWFGPSQDAGR